MRYLAPMLAILSWPGLALAGFAKPLQDVPEHIGTGVFAIDQDWSLFGLIGFVVVIGLLAAFYRRDKEE
jgi:hypothetical protein